MAKRDDGIGAVDVQAVLAERRNRERRKKGWRKFLLWLAAIAGLTYLLFTYVIGVAIVQGNSMAPAMPRGSFILFVRIGVRYGAGDIAVATADGKTVIKRVVACEGDAVAFDINTGALMINGQAETSGYERGKTLARGVDRLTVSSDHAYLLGDNREISTDSRDFGEVPLAWILGKVFFIARGV